MQTMSISLEFFTYMLLFLEAGSKFYTKFKVKWVLFLRQNVLVCGYWYWPTNKYSKIRSFVKQFEEEYGYEGFSIKSLSQQ